MIDVEARKPDRLFISVQPKISGSPHQFGFLRQILWRPLLLGQRLGSEGWNSVWRWCWWCCLLWPGRKGDSCRTGIDVCGGIWVGGKRARVEGNPFAPLGELFDRVVSELARRIRVAEILSV